MIGPINISFKADSSKLDKSKFPFKIPSFLAKRVSAKNGKIHGLDEFAIRLSSKSYKSPPKLRPWETGKIVVLRIENSEGQSFVKVNAKSLGILLKIDPYDLMKANDADNEATDLVNSKLREQFFLNAKKLFEKNNYEKSNKYLELALKIQLKDEPKFQKLEYPDYISKENLKAKIAYALGFCSQTGLGRKANASEAISWFKKCQDEISPDDSKQIETIVNDLTDSLPNVSELTGRKLTEIEANAGEPYAMLRLGKFYINEKREAEGVPWLRKAAEAGNGEAMNALGYCYEQGIGLQANPQLAVYWYKQGTVNGNQTAVINLNRCYFQNIGFDQDAKEKFMKLVDQVEKKGDDFVRLGYFYEKGIGCPLPNLETAFKCYQEGAKLNSANAEYNLARCYENGIGCEPNIAQAIHYYQLAAKNENIQAKNRLQYFDQENHQYKSSDIKTFNTYKKNAIEKNNAQAMNELGKCYENGRGTTINFEKAYECYFQAVRDGNADAMNNFGRFYERGLFVKPDLTKAYAYYKDAAKNGSTAGLNNLGRYLLTENKPEEAFKCFQKAAKKGNVDALLNLAKCYAQGLGVFQNVLKALNLCKEAGKKKEHSNLNLLGVLYEKGLGMKMNANEAFKCYEKAVEAGSEEAIINLARCYENGIGASKDYTKSLNYYKIAAEAGSPEALFKLGEGYENGLLERKDDQSKPDFKEAFKHYKMAAELRHPEGLLNLARSYEKGIGIEKNYEEAFKYYELAADQGNPDAAFKLGKGYEDGILDSDKDTCLKEAYKYYKIAADQGHVEALNSLGELYALGDFYIGKILQMPDRQEAKKYFQDAARQGNQEALFNLGLCFHDEKDYLGALERFTESANKGNILAKYFIGKYYEEGLGVRKNLEIAKIWYERSGIKTKP